jgi:putative sigma-54 modulation protein
MQLHFTGRNIEITPALKTFTEEKFQRINRHNAHINQVNIIFQIEHHTHVAEATLHLNGAEIHATAKTDDMYSAIDELVDKLLTQLTKHNVC